MSNDKSLTRKEALEIANSVLLKAEEGRKPRGPDSAPYYDESFSDLGNGWDVTSYQKLDDTVTATLTAAPKGMWDWHVLRCDRTSQDYQILRGGPMEKREAILHAEEAMERLKKTVRDSADFP